MEEDIDLDKLMAEIFNSQPVQEEATYYLWYNKLNCIVGFGPNLSEEYKDYEYITINEEWFEKLSNSNLNNFIIDLENEIPIDISGNDLTVNVNLHKAGPWTDRLVSMQFVKSTRQLHLKVNTQLPSKKKMWIVATGNYTVPLLTLDIHNMTDEVIDIPNWQNTTSVECISNQAIEIFTAFREVEHEKDL